MSELAKRWAVAGVGIPVILVLLYLGGWPLAVPIAVFAALGAGEVYGLAAEGGTRPLGALGAGAAAALVLMAAGRPTFGLFAPPALGLIGATAVVALVSALGARGPGGRPLESVAVTLFGTLYAGLSLAFVPLIHGLPDAWSARASAGTAGWDGLVLVALPLAVTWLGDALAFFAGTAWGRGGLAPSISPNKSWVGVWAGLAGAGIAGLVWYAVAERVVGSLPHVVPGWMGPAASFGAGVLIGVAAILGDLTESLLKRGAGVKDSGRLFPGHGGVLDRLDALAFTLPAAYVVLLVAAALAGVGSMAEVS